MIPLARVAIINIFVFAIGLMAVNFLIIVLYQGLIMWRTIGAEDPILDTRAGLGNYQNVDWAPTHFEELRNSRVEYRSFYGWRRQPFAGRTITVDVRGIRPTPGTAAGYLDAPLVTFLGGSTMWGEGAPDDQTIPVFFVREIGVPVRVENLGESAYNAFQSYLFLKFRIMEGWAPRLVVSYDGVNDVLGRCAAGNRPYAHGRELQMRDAMLGLDSAHVAPEALSMSYFVLPVKEIVKRVNRRLDEDFLAQYRHICHEDGDRAMAVAKGLLDTWLRMRELVVGNGGGFVAVLQPVAYIGEPDLSHLSLDPALHAQYEIVYSLIRQLLYEPRYHILREHFVDLTDAFDGRPYIYIDFAHVSPEGNAIIARRLRDAMDEMGQRL